MKLVTDNINEAKRLLDIGKLAEARIKYIEAFNRLGDLINESNDEEMKELYLQYSNNIFVKVNEIDSLLQKDKPKQIRKTSFDTIIGHKKAKQEIMDNLLSHDKHLDDIYGIQTESGVILYGPPGTGKTTFAKAVANEVNATFFRVMAKDILSKYQGESENKLFDIIDRASQEEKAIILIEEFEILVPDPSQNESSNRDTITSSFKDFIGGFDSPDNVYIIATTNYPWKVEPAIRRRLTPIYMGLPEFDERIQLMKLKFGKAPLNQIDFDHISGLLEGMSGSDIGKVVNFAKKSAKARDLKRGDGVASGVNQEDVMSGISDTPRSVSKSLLKQYLQYKEETETNLEGNK